MSTTSPTILATSGGLKRGARSTYAFAPLIEYLLELSGAAGRPRLCFIGTAGGDQRFQAALLNEAGAAAGVTVSHLPLFPMPPVADLASFLLEHDAVWVGGGSVANLLALWRLHRLDEALTTAWQAGVVLGGVSAGSICWHVGGTTDSFGPDLVAIDNEQLGFLPYSNGVHYDSESQRRPLFQALIAEGRLPEGYATDDGVGLLVPHRGNPARRGGDRGARQGRLPGARRGGRRHRGADRAARKAEGRRLSPSPERAPHDSGRRTTERRRATGPSRHPAPEHRGPSPLSPARPPGSPRRRAGGAGTRGRCAARAR